jgi:hypothetical protein
MADTPGTPAPPQAVNRSHLLSVKFACAACGQHIEAPRDCFGEVMPCPSCHTLWQIPDIKNAPRSFPVKRLPRFTRPPKA